MTKLLIRLFIKNKDDVQNQIVRNSYGMLGTIVGIIANVLLSGFKFFAGIITSSIAITADALNNLTDAISSVVALVGFKMSSMPSDEDHPFGHGRAEYVSGFIVSMVIILVGFELGKNSVIQIFNPTHVDISPIALFIMLVSIVAKLWMCIFNKYIGKKINSLTLKATAIDSLSDVVATSTVVAGMLITFFTDVNVDAYSGLVVSVFILYAGFNIAKETLNELLGQAPSAEFVDDIENRVLAHKDVVGIHDLIVHNYGANHCVVSLHAEVPCDIDLIEIHDTIDLIERELKNECRCDAVIHIDPIVTDDKVTNAVRGKINALVSLVDSNIGMHDFRMVEGKTHTNLIFDIVVPHKFRLTDTQLIESIRTAVKAIDHTYEVVITVDKAFITK